MKKEDWMTLVSIQHIDKATRYVKRISLSLHLAFLVFLHSHCMKRYCQSL